MPSTKLQNVPDEIREWFSSEKLAFLIKDINERFGLKGDKENAIPKLLFLLEIKEVGPENFRRELSEKLRIFDSSLITSLIDDIKTKILEPIQTPLLNWGVDITKISPAFTQKQEPVPPMPLNTESIKPLPKEMLAPATPSPFLRQKPAFIPRTVQPESQRQKFTPQPPIERELIPPPKPKPVPPPPPLEEVIDLSTFEKIRKPIKPEKKPSEVQPKADGNIIDLR